MTDSRAGQPGEAGTPGAGGAGGTGGTGGAGGRGGTDRHALKFVLIGIGILIALMGVGTALGLKLVNDNTKRIDRNSDSFRAGQVSQTRATRQALYRICRRQMENRAFMWKQAEIEAQEGHPIIPLADLPDRLPILNCTPDLYGREAPPLKRSSMQRYADARVRVIVRGSR